jgi:TraY domain
MERRSIVSAQIPEATRAELERRAHASYRSLSSEIRLALDEHLRRPNGEKQAAS